MEYVFVAILNAQDHGFLMTM